ncbi:peptidase domain-containing ABC transporter [Solimonas soli]|uniref:peptidase domain-containing ABC transporter n=1 Tax=Solimonas soli TaxID=413479 RepID=UPI0004B8C69E|nr:peptidase domain-containing ABC transporter [Solimonas soli]
MIERISFSWRKRVPLVLQTEAAECGLACLSMVAGYYGQHSDLAALRSRFSVSLKGTTLASLAQTAEALGLTARPVKLELDDLPELRLPCVLHWRFNHFVVLESVSLAGAVILDPGSGRRRLSMAELSDAFTGVALELLPGRSFATAPRRRQVSIRRLMGDISGLYRSGLQTLLLALTLEVFFLATPFLTQWVVDDVLVSADLSLLNLLALAFAMLLMMQQFVVLLRGWVLVYFETNLGVQWHINAFAHLLKLPIAYFEKRHIGDVLSRFGSIDTIRRTLTTSFLESLIDGLMSILTAAVMVIYSLKLAAIALAAMAIYAAMRWLWYAALRDATEQEIIHAARQQSHFLESVRGIKAIKLFDRDRERRQIWSSLLVEQVNAGLRVKRMGLAYHALSGLLVGGEHILVLYVGAILVLDHGMTVGMLLAFVAYKSLFDTRVAALIDKMIEVGMLRLQGERLADILLHPAEAECEEPFGAAHDPAPELALRAVSFRYAPSEPMVLANVSLRIAAGESVAITGPSGSGKTTLLHLLLGLLPPSEGEVLLGGRSLALVGARALRRMTSAVMQDDSLFAGSIAENISFFDPRPDHGWIAECAKLAAIDCDIRDMPMGYNTMIGDMGAALSGGQKQRILIARALYKRPKILVLDEATSHLDADRERQINAAIASLNITRIIVAHRAETVRSADRVIALRGGSVLTPCTTVPPDGAGI